MLQTLNGIWSFLRPCLQASRFPLKRVKDCPPSQVKCFRLNSGRSVSINVNKTRKHFSTEKHSWRAHFSQCFPISKTGSFCIVSSVSFCFQDANYAYATRQGILTKIRACKHLQNFCEHDQVSTHLIFASNSSKGQIMRALSNWMGPFDTHPWESDGFAHRRDISHSSS